MGVAGVGAGMEQGECLMGERVVFVPLGLNLRGDLHILRVRTLARGRILTIDESLGELVEVGEQVATPDVSA